MPGTGDKLMTASEIKEVTDTKLVKDFSSLTALSGTPATGDLVPIKSGNNTYKIDYNALASAILGQISSNGVVNVANGGTGSNSATGALSGLIGALDTSSGFSLSDTIPVSINGTAYTITGRTLSNAIGGGGTEQSALTNYVKNCGTITSLPATIEDENITEDMVLLAYSLGTPSAMGSNWSVATDDGEIEITGTISGSTTLTLVFGVGFSVAPTILTDLSSTNPDNILKASPRPGVTGVLPIANGGTGAASASAARTALDVYSKSEVTTAISQSTAFFATVETLAELESALVSKWSGMGNGESIQGSVWTTFSDASKGFNSGIYTVALFRRLSGVYLATFITTTATVISDYYYSGAHHWSSQLSDKAVVSELSGAASGVTTLGRYVYDPSIRTVRIYCASRSTNDMGPSTVLANIPAAYRPKSTVYLVGFYTTGGSGVAYQGRVETNGNVTQMLGSSVREAIIVGEYSID